MIAVNSHTYNSHENFDSKHNQLFLGNLALLVYSPDKISDNNVKDIQVIKFDYKLVRGIIFIAESIRTCFVAFEGSTSKSDWLNNFDIRCISTPIGGIHYGFHKSMMKIPIEDIFKLIQNYSDYEFIFVGHSRGGAFAQLFATWFLHYSIKVKGVMTFGSPKVGDKNWANYVERKKLTMIRFVNVFDPVPYLPPSNIKEIIIVPILCIPIIIGAIFDNIVKLANKFKALFVNIALE